MSFIKCVHVEKAGTLNQLIPYNERDKITTLIITGFLEESDFDNVIDDMCRVEYDYEKSNFDEDNENLVIDWDATPLLRELDMGGCEIVGKNFLPFFGSDSVLEKLIFPRNIDSTMTNNLEESFGGCCLKSIYLPDTLKILGGFGYNENLTELIIPENVEEIYPLALSHCTSLKSINIPAKAKLKGNPFGGCSSLQHIELHPENPYYTIIDNVLFTKDKKELVAYPAGLPAKSYTIPISVEILGEDAFEGTLLHYIIMPTGLKKVNRDCFMMCKNLQILDFPDSVEHIESRAISYCNSLYSVKLPSYISTIETNFSKCPKLKAISIPSSIKRISLDTLIWNEEGFETIILNEGLEEIYTEVGGIYCFTKKGNLKDITFPQSIKKIPSGIFHNCINIKAFNVHPENSYYTTIDGALCSKNGKELVAVPNYSRTSYIIPDGIEEIQEGVFWRFSKLTKLILPNSLIKIGSRAFDSCHSLTEITIPKNVTEIEERAFDECNKLKTIIMLPLLPPIMNDKYQQSNLHKSITLCVPASSVDTYKTHPFWSNYNIVAI